MLQWLHLWLYEEILGNIQEAAQVHKVLEPVAATVSGNVKASDAAAPDVSLLRPTRNNVSSRRRWLMRHASSTVNLTVRAPLLGKLPGTER